MKYRKKKSKLVPPISALASNLSLFREILRVGTWLEALLSLYSIATTDSDKKVPITDIITDVSDLYSTFLDDVHCLIRMGVFHSERVSTFAEDQAAQAWLLAIVLNIRKEYMKYQTIQSKRHEKDDSKLQHDAYWSIISMSKLFCDGVFCSVDIWNLPSFLDPSLVQIIFGMSSGILSYSKLYHKAATASA